MNEEIVIKYKEETLIKNDMSEREKAIWDNGYIQGFNDLKKKRDFAPIGVAVIIVIIYLIVGLI